MVKLINLSRCRSKWCMHQRWPLGPTDGSVTHECPRITTACMHVAQRGVVWCLNSQFHNFDVARASLPKKSRHWVRCTCYGRVRAVYASPLPPLRRVLYTTITQKKDSTLLVKLTSLPSVRQSDGRRPREPTESVTRKYRVSSVV